MAIYGPVMASNVLLDHSRREVFYAPITSRSVSSDKGPHFWVHLGEWNGREAGDEINVPLKIYSRLHVGDKVRLVTGPGAWGIGWFVALP